MSSYKENKHHLLKYQKNSKKYKVYKKEYDKDYRKKNANYASFRALKCKYYKKFGKEIGKVRMISYLLDKQTKTGQDVTMFLEKL